MGALTTYTLIHSENHLLIHSLFILCLGTTVNTEMIHTLLRQIRLQIPTMSGLLMNCLIETFPDHLRADSSVVGGYVQQLLSVIQYIPELRPQILKLIVEKMIVIDVERGGHNGNVDRQPGHECKDPAAAVSDDEEDSSECDDAQHDQHGHHGQTREDDLDYGMDGNGNDGMSGDEEDDDEDTLTQNLDQLMCLMFEYINIVHEDDEALFDELCHQISRIFESVILSAHQVCPAAGCWRCFCVFYLFLDGILWYFVVFRSHRCSLSFFIFAASVMDLANRLQNVL